jgi:hypothetical protein
MMRSRLKRKLGQRRLVDRSGKDEPSYSRFDRQVFGCRWIVGVEWYFAAKLSVIDIVIW